MTHQFNRKHTTPITFASVDGYMDKHKPETKQDCTFKGLVSEENLYCSCAWPILPSFYRMYVIDIFWILSISMEYTHLSNKLVLVPGFASNPPHACSHISPFVFRYVELLNTIWFRLSLLLSVLAYISAGVYGITLISSELNSMKLMKPSSELAKVIIEILSKLY